MASSSSTLSTPSASDGHVIKYQPQTTPVQQQSPRNTSQSGGSTSSSLHFGVIEVPKQMQDGEKFIKWDEVSFTLCLLLHIPTKLLPLSVTIFLIIKGRHVM